MKFKIFFSLWLIFGGGFLFAGLSTKQINDYHVGIGNKLIKLKKDFPGTEQVVHSLLDHFGKYSSFSRSLIQSKKNYKNFLKEEIKSTEKLKRENARLKEKMLNTKNTNLEIVNKFKATFEEFKNKINEKKNELAEKSDAIEKLEKQIQILVAEKDSLKNESNYKNNDVNLTSTSDPMSPL